MTVVEGQITFGDASVQELAESLRGAVLRQGDAGGEAQVAMLEHEHVAMVGQAPVGVRLQVWDAEVVGAAANDGGRIGRIATERRDQPSTGAAVW